MATQHADNGESSRLLALPGEVRDMILAFTLVDFPDLSLDDMVGRSKEISDDLAPEMGRFNEESSEGSESEEDDLSASETVDYVLNAFLDTHEIDTNIFLTCHQIFDEAKDVLMRQGRLVRVIASNFSDLPLRLYTSQICVIDQKYRNLSILTYDSKYWWCRTSALSNLPLPPTPYPRLKILHVDLLTGVTVWLTERLSKEPFKMEWSLRT